jgi:hypothetical protein
MLTTANTRCSSGIDGDAFCQSRKSGIGGSHKGIGARGRSYLASPKLHWVAGLDTFVCLSLWHVAKYFGLLLFPGFARERNSARFLSRKRLCLAGKLYLVEP